MEFDPNAEITSNNSELTHLVDDLIFSSIKDYTGSQAETT
jgi:hypothetical protein